MALVLASYEGGAGGKGRDSVKGGGGGFLFGLQYQFLAGFGLAFFLVS